jgi:hypothetical protein
MAQRPPTNPTELAARKASIKSSISETDDVYAHRWKCAGRFVNASSLRSRPKAEETDPMTVPAGWISEGWIYSEDESQSARYWIKENWIWGPVGAEEMNTQHWIHDGWIWGPVGAGEVATGYFIKDNWIYGPSAKLPFAD